MVAVGEPIFFETGPDFLDSLRKRCLINHLTHPDADDVMRASEVLLASGFLCAALAAGLCQFVMIGLIGVGLFPLAVILLLSGVVLVRVAEPVSLWQCGTGVVVYCMGVLALLVLAGQASTLGFKAATSAAVPRISEWGLLVLMSVVPAIAIPVGLRFRAQWPWRRCAVWGIVAWSVLPTAVIVFWILTLVLPLTA